GELRRLVEIVELQVQGGVLGDRLARLQRHELVAAVESARQRPARGIGEALLAELEYSLQCQIVPHDLVVFEPKAAGDEILVPSQSRLVEDRVRSERGWLVANQAAIWEVETRSGGNLDQSEVKAVYERIEIMIEIRGTGDIQRIPALRLQIVAVERRAATEDASRGLLAKLVAQQHWPDRRRDDRRAGNVGVRLIL